MHTFWWKEERTTVQTILLLSSGVLIWIQSNSEGTNSRLTKTQPSPADVGGRKGESTHIEGIDTQISPVSFITYLGQLKGVGEAVLKRRTINRCKTIRYSDQELPQSCDLTASWQTH